MQTGQQLPTAGAMSYMKLSQFEAMTDDAGLNTPVKLPNTLRLLSACTYVSNCMS